MKTASIVSAVRVSALGAPLIALFVVVGAARATPASDQSQRTTRDQVYTSAQANRGEALYKDLCQSCHPTATYTGNVFLTWQGRTLAELLEFLQEKMPKNDPGSLTEEEYAEVIAYLLRLNALPAAATPLASTNKPLQSIRIDVIPKGR